MRFGFGTRSRRERVAGVLAAGALAAATLPAAARGVEVVVPHSGTQVVTPQVVPPRSASVGASGGPSSTPAPAKAPAPPPAPAPPAKAPSAQVPNVAPPAGHASPPTSVLPPRPAAHFTEPDCDFACQEGWAQRLLYRMALTPQIGTYREQFEDVDQTIRRMRAAATIIINALGSVLPGATTCPEKTPADATWKYCVK